MCLLHGCVGAALFNCKDLPIAVVDDLVVIIVL
jgi:hypothetical protein